MACAMSTFERCLVSVMCGLVQWLWRWTLSPCRRGWRPVWHNGVVQKGQVFMVFVVVIVFKVSLGWCVWAAKVRAVCDL